MSKIAVDVPASSRNRALGFLEEFLVAPNDADLELMLGTMEDGSPAIAIRLSGMVHGFSVKEARTLADIVEGTMNKFPGEPESQTFPNLIVLLRAGADIAEQESPTPSRLAEDMGNE
jgi:hypothetical protein